MIVLGPPMLMEPLPATTEYEIALWAGILFHIFKGGSRGAEVAISCYDCSLGGGNGPSPP